VSDAQKKTNVIFQMMNSRFKDFLW
jgi:hypothetical protein